MSECNDGGFQEIQAVPDQVEADGFWSKFSSIPIVQGGLGKVQEYANSNTLGRYAIKQAESTWSKASSQVASASYAQPYLKKIDALGCKSLEIIEQRFPVVLQPVDEIVNVVKRSPHQVYGDVRNRVRTHLSTAANPVNERFNHAMDQMESLVDRWLPDDQQVPTENTVENEAVAQKRLYRFASHVSHRLSQRVPQTKADFARLAETIQLLQETTQHITKMNDSLSEWAVASRNLAAGVQNQVKGGLEATRNATNERLNELSAELIGRLDAASSYLKTVRLPSIVQARIDPLVQFATHEYGIIRTEAFKADLTPLQKATHIIQMTQARILPMLHESMDAIQEQLRYYSVYAHVSRNKMVGGLKEQLNSLGIIV